MSCRCMGGVVFALVAFWLSPSVVFAQVDRCPTGEICGGSIPGIQYFWAAVLLYLAFRTIKILRAGNHDDKREVKGILLALVLTGVVMVLGFVFFGFGGAFLGMLSFIPISHWLEPEDLSDDR